MEVLKSLLPFLFIIGVFASAYWMVRKRLKNRVEKQVNQDPHKGEKQSSMGDVRSCTECKGEIPKKSKRCMHCGAKQKDIGLGGMFLGAVFATFVIVMVYDSVTTPDAPKIELTAEEKAANAAKYAAEMDAIETCQNAVRQAAKFPSTIDFDNWDTRAMKEGGWIVLLPFEAKNGFGNLIPQTARCEVKNGVLQHFSVVNR